MAHYIYTNSDLPFENYKDNLKIWQSVVLAGIIDWAGSRRDPWAVGAEPDFDKVVEKCWLASFLTTINKDHKAVYAVVCVYLLSSTSLSIVSVRLPLLSETGIMELANMCSGFFATFFPKNHLNHHQTRLKNMSHSFLRI